MGGGQVVCQVCFDREHGCRWGAHVGMGGQWVLWPTIWLPKSTSCGPCAPVSFFSAFLLFWGRFRIFSFSPWVGSPASPLLTWKCGPNGLLHPGGCICSLLVPSLGGPDGQGPQPPVGVSYCRGSGGNKMKGRGSSWGWRTGCDGFPLLISSHPLSSFPFKTNSCLHLHLAVTFRQRHYRLRLDNDIGSASRSVPVHIAQN